MFRWTKSSSSNSKPPVSATRRRKLLLSYLPDWLLTILLAAAFFSLEKVEGFRRQFSLDESSIQHTYTLHERVPNLALVFICFVAPILIQPIINLLTVRSWWDLHNATLGLILGLALTGSVTQAVKITVGRPRPDLIDRCQPPDGAADPPFGLSTWYICTRTDNAILRDGFRSFPSGHSSLSFAGLGFLSFYLAGKMHLFDRRGYAHKSWLSLGPFLAAALVAISRTMDYRHHWQDVFIGSILGTFCAFFAYRQYYPHLGSDDSHLPFSPRIAREYSETLPTHRPRVDSEHAHLYPPTLGQPTHGSASSLPGPPRRPGEQQQHQRRYTDEPVQGYEMEGGRPVAVVEPQRQNTHEVWRNGEFAKRPSEEHEHDDASGKLGSLR